MNSGVVKPNVLMFAPMCYPPSKPEAFVNSNLTLAMLDAGWNIDVITMPESHFWYPADKDAYARLENHIISVPAVKKSIISRYLKAFKTAMISGHIVTGFDWALPAAIEALKLIKQKKYDVIISRALPQDAHFAALITAQKTGIPWIANWNDPVPWEKFPIEFDGGEGPEAHLDFKTTRFFRVVASTADWHTFPSARLRDYILKYLPGEIVEKCSIIPHIALPAMEISSQRNEKCRFLYAGSLMHPRSPDNFLKAVSLFCNSNHISDIEIVFIADDCQTVHKYAKKHDVMKYVKVEPSRPYSEMEGVLNTADVLVVIEALMSEGIFLPSKFVDYIRTGKPVFAISPSAGTLADIINHSGGGVAVDNSSVDDIYNGIQRLHQLWSAGSLNETFSSKKLLKAFSSDTILNQYLSILNKIAV